MDILARRDHFSKFEHVESKLVVGGDLGGRPRISIVIPTYRRPELLKEALRSALDQSTNVEYEVIVVDNDTTMADRVDEVVREFRDSRVRLFRNAENIGMFGNWNRCIELARSEWVSILSDDDLLDRSFVEAMLAVTDRDESISLLSCRAELVDERSGRLGRFVSLAKREVKRIKARVTSGAVVRLLAVDAYLDSVSSLGMIFRRRHAIDVGGYDDEAFPSADYVFFVTYFLRFHAYRLDRRLAYYRVHENETANPATSERSIAVDLALRRAMEGRVAAPIRLLRLYAQLFALTTARHFRNFWGVELDVERIRREHGLTRLPAPLFFPVVRFAVRAYCRFARPRRQGAATTGPSARKPDM